MSNKKISIPLQTYFEALLIVQDIVSGESVSYTDIERLNYNLRKELKGVRTLNGVVAC